MWQIVTYPAAKALTVDEAKRHLRILDSSFDTLIGEYIDSAQMMLYKETNVICTPMEFKQTYQVWEDFDFNLDPFTSVIIQYYDVDDNIQTLPTTKYKVYDGAFPVVFTPTDMPALFDRANPIIVNVVCGYAAAPDNVKQCLRMIVADLYENTQTDVQGNYSVLSRNTDYQLSLISRRAGV